MAAAARAGITRAAASPAASPASTSSIARSQASSDTASAIAGMVRLGPKSRSDGKEDGLLLALQAHVEAQHAAVVARHQRVPAFGRHGVEGRVGGVGGALLGEG